MGIQLFAKYVRMIHSYKQIASGAYFAALSSHTSPRSSTHFLNPKMSTSSLHMSQTHNQI